MVCCSRNKQIAIANSQLDHSIFLPLLEQAFDPEESQTASRRHKSSKEQIVEVPLIMSHLAFRKTEHRGFEGDKIRWTELREHDKASPNRLQVLLSKLEERNQKLEKIQNCDWLDIMKQTSHKIEDDLVAY